MLDIKFIRENKDLLKEAIKNKKIKLNLDDLLKIDDKRRELQQEIESIRKRRNEIADFMKKSRGKLDDALVKEGGK